MNRKSEHTTRTQIYHLRSGTLFPLIPFPFNQSCSSKNPGPSDAHHSGFHCTDNSRYT